VTFEVLEREILSRIGNHECEETIRDMVCRSESAFEAISQVTSRGTNFEAFRIFVKVRVAHLEALWKEYIKPRWARLRMNLYCGKQRAFANFFNHLSTLKEDKTQRLEVAYGEGRWLTQKGYTPVPTTRTY